MEKEREWVKKRREEREKTKEERFMLELRYAMDSWNVRISWFLLGIIAGIIFIIVKSLIL